jgi:hypothetical protein
MYALYTPELNNYEYKTTESFQYSVSGIQKIIIDHENQSICQYFGDTKINLKYCLAKDIEKNLKKSLKDKSNSVTLAIITTYTVQLNNSSLIFSMTGNIFKLIQGHLINNDLPSFIKIQYEHHNNIDIEWTGDNYQAEEYFLKIYIIDPDLYYVKSKLDYLFLLKEQIILNTDFYAKLGYDITFFTNSCSTYPYSYKFYNHNNQKEIVRNGISHVFEEEVESLRKSCFMVFLDIVSQYQINSDLSFIKNNELSKFEIERLVLLINEFVKFLKHKGIHY